MSLKVYVSEKATKAKKAARQLATLTTEQKNRALLQMADVLGVEQDRILAANAIDIQKARQNGMPESRVDRLLLTPTRIASMQEGLRQVVELPDPVGEVLETIERADGLRIEKVRVPLGVVAMIYESRPNVTVDAAALALKTGNAVILRGGKEALESNKVLVDLLQLGLQLAGLPMDAIQLIDRVERETIDLLITARGLVDLVIPRGGAALIERVVSGAQVPVIETGVGNCHVYVDAAADPEKAKDVMINAKVQRPSVCNAIETLLVHREWTNSALPQWLEDLQRLGVQIRGCDRTRSVVPSALPVAEEDYATEFLDLVLAVRVVDDLEEALEHIDRYGTKHSESIVTEDDQAAERFLQEVDAAVVYHNASTRFTDGFEFGFGAEIGISTQKTHARGPMGLREMTAYKYVARGNGQIRQ